MARKRDATPKPARPRKTNAFLPKGYEELLGQLKERIRSAQLRAGLAVNRELIELYWQIGRSIVERQRSDGWGKSIVERLARDIQSEFPVMSGFSPRNVWRMRAFYLAYTQEVRKLPRPVAELDGENLPRPVAEIPWGSILSAADDLLRHPDDKPSIGIILCKAKNQVVAEYALRDLAKPVGVSTYITKLVESLPPALRGTLPTPKELEAELRKDDKAEE